MELQGLVSQKTLPERRKSVGVCEREVEVVTLALPFIPTQASG